MVTNWATSISHYKKLGFQVIFGAQLPFCAFLWCPIICEFSKNSLFQNKRKITDNLKVFWGVFLCFFFFCFFIFFVFFFCFCFLATSLGPKPSLFVFFFFVFLVFFVFVLFFFLSFLCLLLIQKEPCFPPKKRAFFVYFWVSPFVSP